jgi:hypothetical protein
MTRSKSTLLQHRRELLDALRELRMKTHEMDQKLDHLIHRLHRFDFTTDFSQSSIDEFTG